MQLQLVSELKNVLHVYKTVKWTPRWFKLAHLTRRIIVLLQRPSTLNPLYFRQLMLEWDKLAIPNLLPSDIFLAVSMAELKMLRSMGLENR